VPDFGYLRLNGERLSARFAHLIGDYHSATLRVRVLRDKPARNDIFEEIAKQGGKNFSGHLYFAPKVAKYAIFGRDLALKLV
jgi:hypothetical protein